MSEAEALLNSLTEDIPTHEHPVVDTDSHFVIDPDTREITNSARRQYIMQGDHNSEVYTFEAPRYIDGHDMMLCNQIKVHYINISEDKETQNADTADASPLRIKEDDENVVICTWCIDRKATQLVGNLSFSLEFQCVVDNGEVVYEWNTDIYSDVEIKDSLDHGEQIAADYSDILEQWRAKLFGAGNSVIEDINALSTEQKAAIQKEGAAQVNAIESASTEQQAAIQLKGEETLKTIPDDYTATYSMAEEALRKKANAIELESEGDAIFADDSADAHLLGLKVYGKTTQAITTGVQLANLPDGEIELGGILWTCHGGVVTAKGTCNAESSSTGVSIHHNLTGMTGTYYVSGNSEPVKVYVRVKENGTERWFNNGPVTLDGTEDDVLFYMQVAGVGTTVNTTLYPMLNAGDKALPWEPYTGGKPSPNPDYPQGLVSVEPTVGIYGKNIIPNMLTRVDGGITFTTNDDGSFTVNGTADKYRVGTSEVVDATPYRGKTVTLSSKREFGHGFALQIYSRCKSGNVFNSITSGNAITFTIPEDADTIALQCYVTEGKTIDNSVVYPQLELGDKETDFEPYKPVQTLLITQVIPGIPVPSGGNYTDPSGQQWICDEIDFERGVYVQRVSEYVVTGTPAFNETLDQAGRFSWNCLPEYFATGREVCLCNYAKWRAWGISDYKGVYDYGGVSVTQLYYSPAVSMTAEEVNAKFAKMIAEGNPPTVVAQLATPIETPIDGTAMAAFKALHTNYPNTTILNDAGAWMSVKYNADTKTYVDNPKVLKLVDSSTGVVYELKIVDGVIVANPV